MKTWKLYIDGASRGNPGPAGVGVALSYHDTFVLTRGAHIGPATNNQAEYLALVYGAFMLTHLKPRSKDPLHTITIIADSELLIKQMRGIYRVKNATLKILHALAQELLTDFTCHFVHVLREKNETADALANQGIDTRKPLPNALVQILEQRGIVSCSDV